MTRVLLDLARRLGFEVAAFLPHLGCGNSKPRLLEPYLFSGSSSSSAAHKGPDSEGSSSPAQTKHWKNHQVIEWLQPRKSHPLSKYR